MTDVVRQIRHDLEQIEKAVLALGEDFNQVYDNYLAALRTSVQKQVVLACYHLCTQSYPERFLELTFRQREGLQQSIQRLIQELQQKLEHAYVLATDAWVEEEEEIITRSSRRRSLPSSGRSRRRGRDASRSSRDMDDSGDRDGPSIELIAITNMDGDDVLEDAEKDPFLAAALSEFADSLALDEDAILKRVKQELLKKVTRSSSNAIEGNDIDDENDEASDSAVEEAENLEDAGAMPPSSDADIDGSPQSQDMGAPSDNEHSGPHGDSERSEVSAIALSTNATGDAVAPVAPVAPEKPPFPGNPEGKKFATCDETLTPDVLAARQEQLEDNLTGFLRDLSKQINHELHEVGMIPKKIPSAVLRAALQTDMSSDFNGSPNVLNLLVEAEGKSKESKAMRVTALRLRPPELEFSDPHLSAGRSRIRELTGKLQKLGKQYHKKLREKAIAEAESAWRSSWYEFKD